jgi:membrane-associated phospholipid phosphatase
MTARFLLYCLLAASLVAEPAPVLAEQGIAAGQSPTDAQGSADREGKPSTDELLQDLLTTGSSEADDLGWLYSDEVYEPSELAGQPVVVPALPEPAEGAPRQWHPGWRRFGLWDYVLTATGLAVAGGSALIPTSPGRWQARNDVDEWVRDRIGVQTYDRGRTARDISDLGLSVAVAYPFLVDSLIVTFWHRNSQDVATQMALIDAEGISIAMALQGLTAGLTSRPRPYVRNCGVTMDERLSDCRGRKPYRSFLSGHTAVAFAAAGASCSNHAHHAVFGTPASDASSCAATLALAATVGTMRVVGDQHFLSDVAVGATVGTLSGVGIPWLLHYGPWARPSSLPPRKQAVALSLVPVPQGLGVGGTF